MRVAKIGFRQIISFFMVIVICFGFGMSAKVAKAEAVEKITEDTISTIKVYVPEEAATVYLYKIVDIYDKYADDVEPQPEEKYTNMNWASLELEGWATTYAKGTERLYTLNTNGEFTPRELENLTPAQQQAFYFAMARAIALDNDAFGLEALESVSGLNTGRKDYTYRTREEAGEITEQNITLGQYMTVTTGSGYIYQPTTVNVIPKLNPVTQKYEAVAQTFNVEVKDSKPTIQKEVDDNYVAFGDTATFTIDIDVPVYGADYDYNDLVFDIVDVMSKAFTYKAGTVVVEGITNAGGAEETKTILSGGNYAVVPCDQVYKVDDVLDMVYSSSNNMVYSLSGRSDAALNAYLDSIWQDGSTTYNDRDEVLAELGQITGETGLYVKFPYNGIKGYEKLRITYQATITTDAEIGSEKNINDVYLRYSVDPANPKEPERQKDDEKVYTFGIDVLKVDAADDSPLPDAIFDLYQLLKGNMSLEEWNALRTTPEYIANPDNYSRTSNGDGTYTVYHRIKTDLSTDEKGRIQVNGLDIGTYQLRETQAPSGYNLLSEPRQVTITPTSSDVKQAMEYSQDISDVPTEDDIKGTVGHSGVRVLNAKGITLPSTGGSGVTMFWITGFMLMSGAMGFIVFKNRQH